METISYVTGLVTRCLRASALLAFCVVLFARPAAAATPILVKDIVPGPGSSFGAGGGLWRDFLAVAGGKLYFPILDPDPFAFWLWKSDGTSTGTAPVWQAGWVGDSFAAVGGALFFTDINEYESRLLRTDGTVVDVLKSVPQDPYSLGTFAESLVDVSGLLYFAAPDGGLWKSDGTEAGTVRVSEYIVGGSGSSPPEITGIGSTVYFVGYDPIHLKELWTSEGTPETTQMVKDIGTETSGMGQPYSLTAVGTTLYFRASSGHDYRGRPTDTELWKSDGTADGTVRVKDITVGTGSTSMESLTAVGTTLFFIKYDGVGSYSLWKSDGTEAGTLPVKDLGARPPSSPSYPGGFALTAAGGTLYFVAYDAALGLELWKSDGTEAGTLVAQDVWPGADSSSPTALTALGGTLYFAADDGTHGREIWKATPQGAALLSDVNPGTASSKPAQFVKRGDSIFFSAFRDDVGRELWRVAQPRCGLGAELVLLLPVLAALRCRRARSLEQGM